MGNFRVRQKPVHGVPQALSPSESDHPQKPLLQERLHLPRSAASWPGTSTASRTEPQALTKKPLAIVCAVMVLAAILCVGGFLAYRALHTDTDTSPIPKNIRSSLTFSPFVLPVNTPGYTASDYTYDKAEDGVQILSYVINLENGTSVALSEYIQPPQFTEINEYKERFLTNVAKQYDSVQSANGTIYLGRLTRPQKDNMQQPSPQQSQGDQQQNGQQLGVMLERGLIVFMRPQKELDQSQWRSLGERLEIQKMVK